MPFKGDPTRAPTWAPAPVREAWDAGSDGIARTLKRAKTARRLNPFRRRNMAWEPQTLRTTDGVSLDAWFVPGAPEEARDDGLMVLMHHHYGGQKATLLPWIHLFWRLGVPTLSFDARGHGSSDATPVGRGSFSKRAADVRAGYAALQERGATAILGYGQSQGAASLVMGVAGRPDLAGLILDSGPAPDMGTAAWGLAGNMLGGPSSDRAARALLAARIVPGTEPVRYLPALWTALARVRGTPLLWLHGDRDDVIRRAWSHAWFRALSPRGAGLWEAVLVPGADHVRTLQTDGVAVEAAVARLLARARLAAD